MMGDGRELGVHSACDCSQAKTLKTLPAEGKKSQEAAE